MCGCGNAKITVAAQPVEPQSNNDAQVFLMNQTTQVSNALPQWSGNKLVPANHKAVKNVTGFHLMKSSR